MNARPVHTEKDVETLRVIRNSGRQWMTRDTHEITPAEQRAWWAARAPHDYPIFLFSESNTDVGYGLLRLEGGRWWCSLAVAPRYRGQGYGTGIYRWLALAISDDVWAEILADNTPSIRAALRAGYEIAYAQDRTAVLVYKK
jgi:RimJ/RimL family protein N-acetyltransferase